VILNEICRRNSSEEKHAMAAAPSIDLSGWMSEHLEQASPDLLRAMLSSFIEALMGADADAICNAGYGERTDARTNTRNGYRHRDWDTRAGTIDVAIPKLRSGSYFPDWLLTHRRRRRLWSAWWRPPICWG
jgi:transposase-like protein